MDHVCSLQVIRMLIVMLIVFICGWGPFMYQAFAAALRLGGKVILRYRLMRNVTFVFSFGSAALNPLMIL